MYFMGSNSNKVHFMINLMSSLGLGLTTYSTCTLNTHPNLEMFIFVGGVLFVL